MRPRRSAILQRMRRLDRMVIHVLYIITSRSLSEDSDPWKTIYRDGIWAARLKIIRTHLKISFQRRDARFLRRGDGAEAEM